MDFTNDSIEQLQLKLNILNADSSTLTEILSSQSKVNKYIQLLNIEILKGQKIYDNRTKYIDECDHIAFKILSCSPFSSKIHLCKTFRCSNDMLLQWSNTHESFNNAVVQGLTDGEIIARELLLKFSFEPSNKVNTNLIKILSNNVYKIEEQLAESKVITNVYKDPEKVLKERGIPIPEIAIEDIENGNN